MEQRLSDPERHQAKLKNIRDGYNSMIEEFRQQEPEAFEKYEDDRLQTRINKRNLRKARADFDINRERGRKKRYDDSIRSDPDKLRKVLDRRNLMRKLKKNDPVKHAELVLQSKLDRRNKKK